ncbi:MAG: fatty acid desaturase [Gammaproteobacteria bacterium]|nr:fatty acid desaturase [Gammaproteobacteria bacterium]
MKLNPAAATLLSPEQLARVRARSDLWGLGLVAHAWLVISGSMALVAYAPNLVTYIFAVMLIGSRQLGILILMHDGAHGTLARTPKLNHFLSQWGCAYLMLAETAAYRRYHLEHHARTMQDDDPDLVLIGHYPIARASLRRKLLRDLLGRTGYAQRRDQLRSALGPRDLGWPVRVQNLRRKLGPQLAFNLGLFGVLSASGHWAYYFTLWILPALTWQQMVLRIRNIAEHAAIPDRNDPFKNARTTIASVVERMLIAPYWVNYHLEHHLLMWVPCYRLPLLRQYLVENGHRPHMATSVGYWAVLREVTYPDREARDRGSPRESRAVGTFGEGFSA